MIMDVLMCVKGIVFTETDQIMLRYGNLILIEMNPVGH